MLIILQSLSCEVHRLMSTLTVQVAQWWETWQSQKRLHCPVVSPGPAARSAETNTVPCASSYRSHNSSLVSDRDAKLCFEPLNEFVNLRPQLPTLNNVIPRRESKVLGSHCLNLLFSCAALFRSVYSRRSHLIIVLRGVLNDRFRQVTRQPPGHRDGGRDKFSVV